MPKSIKARIAYYEQKTEHWRREIQTLDTPYKREQWQKFQQKLNALKREIIGKQLKLSKCN